MNSFELGQIVITDAAQEVLTALGIKPLQLISRHRKQDWGDLPHEAKQANHIALSVGGALHSSYTLGTHVVCVTTNPQRSLTTILLVSEMVSNL
jgi:hypothetical protein